MDSEMETNLVEFIEAWSTTDEELKTHMSSIDTSSDVIISCCIQRHTDSGRSKGWGLVEFSCEDFAHRAVHELDKSELNGRAIHLRFDRSSLDSSQGHSIYVGNLPWTTNKSTLATLFSKYKPYDIHIKTNMAGRSRGFAMLRFDSIEQACQAVNEMDGCVLDGRKMQVRDDRSAEIKAKGNKNKKKSCKGKIVVESGESTQCLERINDRCTVFVGNLARMTKDEHLLKHFSSISAKASAHVQLSQAGRSKRWGLVKFETPDLAQLAVETTSNSVLHEHKLNVRLENKKNQN